MRFFCLLVFIFSSSIPAMASVQTLTTQVREVDFGHQMGDEVLVFLTSGDVARLRHWDTKLISSLKKAEGKKTYFKFSLDSDRHITKMLKAAAPAVKEPKEMMSLYEEDYVPTTIANMKLASSYIAESRHPTKEETQCFNRAMVWTYEWWRKHSLKTNKVYVFWTKEYVRQFGFKWWFHVSPYAHIMDTDGVVKERVLDVKWLSRPYKFQEWADYHSSHDVPCRVVKNYSEYADFPFDTDRCYFIKTNMYTWMPADIEMKEGWGYQKTGFHMDEVKAAYLEAFDIVL